MKKPGPFSVGGHVTLAEHHYHYSPHGVVQNYVGYFIGSKIKGRVYRIAWLIPHGAGTTHFESELKRLGKETVFQLKERPR